MKRVFVTGAQGFVGRYLVRELLAQHDVEAVLGAGRSKEQRSHFTHAIARNATPIPAALPDEIARALDDVRYRYACVDVTDADSLRETLEAFAPDTIFHMASALRDDPVPKLFRVNVEGTSTLMRAAAPLRIERIVLGSSGGIYGIPRRLPISENDPWAPIDPYSITKAAGEMAGLAASDGRSVNVLIARLFNLIGPGQDERHVGGRFTSQLLSYVRDGVPVRVGDLAPTRDFIDVRDVASALVTIARHGTPGDAYNVGSGRETSIERFYELTSRAACNAYVTPERNAYTRTADIPRHVADTNKLRSLGHRDRYTLEQSIADLVAYYRAATVSGIGDVTA